MDFKFKAKEVNVYSLPWGTTHFWLTYNYLVIDKQRWPNDQSSSLPILLAKFNFACSITKHYHCYFFQQALYASKIVSYAQGFMLMREAAKEFGWKLNFGGIALMWRGGCIIRRFSF